MAVRMSVNMSNEVGAIIKDLAARQGVSVTEVVRRSFATEMWREEVVRSGGKVLVELESGRVRQVEFPY